MKTIFFDLDNTLTDRNATVNAYADYFLIDFKPSLRSGISKTWLAEQFIKFDQGGYSSHADRSQAISELNIWCGDAINATELSQHWQNWVPNHSIAMRGMAKCLGELKAKGFALCLVTNGQTKNQSDKVKRLGLKQYFQEIIISGDIGIKKPDPRIFELALKKMNCKACDAFFVGDHPINDVQGSQQLGLTAIWLEGSHPWPDSLKKPASISRLDQLPSLIFKLSK